MRRVLLSFVGLLAIGLAHAEGEPTGRYRLRIPEDAMRVARLSGKSEPYGRLSLRDGGRFVLDTDDIYRRGRFLIVQDRLVLLPDDGGEIRGEIKEDALVVEGLTFDREGASAAAGRRFPTDGATGRNFVAEVGAQRLPAAPAPVLAPVDTKPFDDRPAIVEAPRPAIMAAGPELVAVTKVPEYKAAAVRRLEAKAVSGVWTVRRNGFEEKGQRMDLRKDGTFRFSMANATSEGTWSVEDGQIVLVYTKMDGQPLEEGASGRKCISVSDDASAFQIDTYRYERANG